MNDFPIYFFLAVVVLAALAIVYFDHKFQREYTKELHDNRVKNCVGCQGKPVILAVHPVYFSKWDRYEVKPENEGRDHLCEFHTAVYLRIMKLEQHVDREGLDG